MAIGFPMGPQRVVKVTSKGSQWRRMVSVLLWNQLFKGVQWRPMRLQMHPKAPWSDLSRCRSLAPEKFTFWKEFQSPRQIRNKDSASIQPVFRQDSGSIQTVFRTEIQARFSQYPGLPKIQQVFRQYSDSIQAKIWGHFLFQDFFQFQSLCFSLLPRDCCFQRFSPSMFGFMQHPKHIRHVGEYRVLWWALGWNPTSPLGDRWFRLWVSAFIPPTPSTLFNALEEWFTPPYSSCPVCKIVQARSLVAACIRQG